MQKNRIYLAPKGSSEEEIEKFAEWMNDFQVTDYTGRTSQITTYSSEKEYLEKAAKNTENRIFNIVNLADDKLVGTVSLENINWIERRYYDKLHMDILENEFKGDYIRNKNIKSSAILDIQ